MARVSREQARLNRETVVQEASRLFRERGVDGVGVADIMAAVGLTHGGFYNQFASKDVLAGEACLSAFSRSHFTDPANRPASLAAFASIYLQEGHVAAPGAGCPVPTFATDAAREASGSPLRRSFTDGFSRMTDFVMSLTPGRGADRRRERALAAIAALVGAVTLARALEDPALADEVLSAVRKNLSAAD